MIMTHDARMIDRRLHEPGSALMQKQSNTRLSEQLQSLYNLIDGPNDAPTHGMMELLGELETEYRKAQDTFHSLAK